MNKLLCLNCYETFHKECLSPNHRDEYICPKTSCAGDLIDLDDMMITPIKILNQKGYHTTFCCSGHSYEKHPNAYISFYKPLPNDIKIEGCWYIDDNRCSIRTLDAEDYKTEYEKYRYILLYLHELIDWVQTLPDLEIYVTSNDEDWE